MAAFGMGITVKKDCESQNQIKSMPPCGYLPSETDVRPFHVLKKGDLAAQAEAGIPNSLADSLRENEAGVSDTTS